MTLSHATVDLPKSSRKLTTGVAAKVAIKLSLIEEERNHCIQDKESLMQVSSKSTNARPKSTTTTEEDAAVDKQVQDSQDEFEIGQTLDKIVMLFAVEREGKRWIDMLSGADPKVFITSVLLRQHEF
ncbi:hypothetical protein N9K47_00200 [bacterium]|nr:hypothetical protein [bacterium]